MDRLSRYRSIAPRMQRRDSRATLSFGRPRQDDKRSNAENRADSADRERLQQPLWNEIGSRQQSPASVFDQPSTDAYNYGAIGSVIATRSLRIRRRRTEVAATATD